MLSFILVFFNLYLDDIYIILILNNFIKTNIIYTYLFSRFTIQQSSNALPSILM